MRSVSYSKNFFIVGILLVISALFPAHVARAVVPVVVVEDVTQTVANMKEFSLDSVAYAGAKIALRAITGDIVTWINNGFKGPDGKSKPAFLTDPAGFFTEVADNAIGYFIEKDPYWKFLCKPFSLDVQLNFGLQYAKPKPYQGCTLSEVLNNTNGAYQKFMSGNFFSVGWSGVQDITRPENNPYGSELIADIELKGRIAKNTGTEEKKLGWSGGFLSWEECEDVPALSLSTGTGPTTPSTGSNITDEPDYTSGLGLRPSNSEILAINAEQKSSESYLNNPSLTLSSSEATNPTTADPYITSGQRNKKCTTQTPGTIIESQLEGVLGTGIRQLELADEFNEIVNALVAQLATQVLGGAKGLLGAGASNGGYLSGASAYDPSTNPQSYPIPTKVPSGLSGAYPSVPAGNPNTDLSGGTANTQMVDLGIYDFTDAQAVTPIVSVASTTCISTSTVVSWISAGATRSYFWLDQDPDSYSSSNGSCDVPMNPGDICDANLYGVTSKTIPVLPGKSYRVYVASQVEQGAPSEITQVLFTVPASCTP